MLGQRKAYEISLMAGFRSTTFRRVPGDLPGDGWDHARPIAAALRTTGFGWVTNRHGGPLAAVRDGDG